MSSIWKHMNNLVFRNAKPDEEEIFSIVQLRAWALLKHKSTKVSFSFSDWCLCHYKKKTDIKDGQNSSVMFKTCWEIKIINGLPMVKHLSIKLLSVNFYR